VSTVLPNTALSNTAPYQALSSAEPNFQSLIERYGELDPFVWHDGGRTGDSKFAAMAVHIIGQQISMIVTFIVYDRLAAAAGGVPTPEVILKLGPDAMRGFGLSRAKADYLIDLSERQLDGRLDIENLGRLTDGEAVARLVEVKGIGIWSAEMFLIHQLHRPDVFPSGDVGLRKGVQRAWDLAELPTPDRVRERAAVWSPYRTYAAALLWASLTPPGTESDPKARALLQEKTPRTASTITHLKDD
jgi:DNA-3-methyladenine glycosylase II